MMVSKRSSSIACSFNLVARSELVTASHEQPPQASSELCRALCSFADVPAGADTPHPRPEEGTLIGVRLNRDHHVIDHPASGGETPLITPPELTRTRTSRSHVARYCWRPYRTR